MPNSKFHKGHMVRAVPARQDWVASSIPSMSANDEARIYQNTYDVVEDITYDVCQGAILRSEANDLTQ